jgi:hypothetical protein
MPRPASPRKSQPARKPGSAQAKSATKSRPAAKAAKPAKGGKGNGGVRSDPKPAPRESRGSGDRRPSEQIHHHSL